MTAKQPNGLRTNSNLLGAIDRLYDRLVTWLYERQDAQRAQHVANRLKRLLSRFPPNPQNIFIEEVRSLVAEAQGDLKSAIKRRLNEISLIHRLHELAKGPDAAHAALILGQYNYPDLRDRHVILAMLHHDNGELDKAIDALLKAKQLCEEHGIKFAAEDLLREYLNKRSITQVIGLRIESDNGSVRAVVLDPEKMDTPLTPADIGQRLQTKSIKSDPARNGQPASNAPKQLLGNQQALPFTPTGTCLGQAPLDRRWLRR